MTRDTIPLAMKKSLLPALLLIATIAYGQTPKTAATSRRVAVRAAHLIDPVDGKRVDDVIVLIENDKVTAVGHGLTIPSDATTIDLGKATLLPGLIDVHTHLTSQSGDYYTDLFRLSAIDNAVRAPTYARRTLLAGF